jgi:hypothetical protein
VLRSWQRAGQRGHDCRRPIDCTFDARPSDAPALDDPYQEHDQRDDQKDVNESTYGVRTDQPQNP